MVRYGSKWFDEVQKIYDKWISFDGYANLFDILYIFRSEIGDSLPTEMWRQLDKLDKRIEVFSDYNVEEDEYHSYEPIGKISSCSSHAVGKVEI